MYFKAAFDEKIPCESKFFRKKRTQVQRRGKNNNTLEQELLLGVKTT